MDKTSIISFRCPPELAREIDAVRKPFGLSRGDWVRAAVRGQLEERDSRIVERLDDVRDEIMKLEDVLSPVMRALMKKATFLLLTHGRISQEEATELVNRHFGRKEVRL